MRGTESGLGFDIELDGRNHLTAVGAVLENDEFRREVTGPPTQSLLALDTFAAPATFVFGHNILWHDLPWLAEHAPNLALLRKPAVDTLILSAIAFAEHPYHALLKDYKVVRDALNDPVADSRISARLLVDARRRLGELAAGNVTFGRVVYSLGVQGLASISQPASKGFAQIFAELSLPSADLDGDVRTLLAGQACTTALESLLPLSD